MQDLTGFYQDQIKTFNEELAKVQKQLLASSMIRLVVFLVAVFGIYFFSDWVKLAIGISLVTIILFIYLVSKHTDLKRKRNKLRKLVAINETELKVLKRDFHHLPNGAEYKNGAHDYSQDIDLFGNGSFYQYLNRTTLPQGSHTLATILTENNIDDILKRQEAIAELSKLPHWRQDFSATALLAKTETTIQTIVKWLLDYKPFIPVAMKFLPWVFSGISVVLVALFFLNVVRESFLIYWIMFGLLITGVFAKKMTRLTASTGKILATFQQYGELLKYIEGHEFESQLLKQRQSEVLSEGKKAGLVLKDFSKLLEKLDQNNNVIYLIFGNGLFLSGLRIGYGIEKWIKQYGPSVEKWFQVIAFFDAYNSLGNFTFNHPNYCFPKLTENTITLKVKEAGHPLLDPKKSVLNDFQIDTAEFFIITGANMAGKSTFLRTVSLQIVMANIGLPVCAKSVEYSPIKLITSMRTTDSLTDDESYFFSELKRLKFIVDQMQEHRYFIVLDEILKGTNSTDKAEGSRKFVERLVASKSTGIIATHDLSLCEVAEALPQVKNYYFDAEITNNELHFDYQFKKGICQNMNASFLLKKMEIVE